MRHIVNRIKRHQDGYLSVLMVRPAQNGKTYRYMLWLGPPEQAQGRPYIAARIKSARRAIQQSIREQCANETVSKINEVLTK